MKLCEKGLSEFVRLRGQCRTKLKLTFSLAEFKKLFSVSNQLSAISCHQSAISNQQSAIRCSSYLSGSSSCNGRAWLGERITSASRFALLSCHIISRQRPHGGRMVPRASTATTREISDSWPLSISAMAACSAQKPRLQAKSSETPEYLLPARERITDATSPALQSSLGLIGLARARA